MKFPELPSGPFIHLQALYLIFHLVEAWARVVEEEVEQEEEQQQQEKNGAGTRACHVTGETGTARHLKVTVRSRSPRSEEGKPRRTRRMLMALRSRVS